MNIHDARLHGVLFLQNPRGTHRLRHHGTAGNDGDGLSFVFVARARNGFERVEEFGLLAAVANDIGDAEFIGRVRAGDDRGRPARGHPLEGE